MDKETLKIMSTIDLMVMLEDCSIFPEDKDCKYDILNELKTRED